MAADVTRAVLLVLLADVTWACDFPAFLQTRDADIWYTDVRLGDTRGGTRVRFGRERGCTREELGRERGCTRVRFGRERGCTRMGHERRKGAAGWDSSAES